MEERIISTKRVIVIRKDLNMSAGKMVAQSLHAAWKTKGNKEYKFDQNNVCIVCGVKSEQKLLNVMKKAEENNIPCGLQIDSGRTEVSPGTITVLSLGPVQGKKIEILNNITKRLQLL